MAAETCEWVIDSKPMDTLIAVGDGSLLRGLAFLKNKIGTLKKPWHNCMMLNASETVGAAATFSIRFKVWQPFKLNAIQYYNDTNTGGALTTIKCNGELVVPRGLTTEDTLQNFTVLRTFANDQVDYIFLFPSGSELEFNGTATNGDTVHITLFGYDLDMQRVD